MREEFRCGGGFRRIWLLRISALLLIGLLGWIAVFGWEPVKLAQIGFSRAKDKTEELIRGPILERNHEEVIAANTEQTLEIEGYLEGLEDPAKRTPEALGLNFASEADYLRSCQRIRSLLASSLGYPPPEAAPITEAASMVPLSEDELATYYDLTVPVFGGMHARGVFMMPRARSAKSPLIIAVHGRGGMPDRPKNGKITVIARHDRDLALGALRRGYAVWQPLLLFYASDRPADIRLRIDVRARECGTTLPAIEIAKISRGLDALLQSGEIDPSRVAMVGMSYGGFYTLYTAALDERIRVAVVAAYFNDRKAVLALGEPSDLSDWRFHNSLSVFQDPTMAALICPRPLQIQAGDHDQLFSIAGTRRTVPAARALYERLNVGQRFSFVEFVGRHDFNGEVAWSFIDQFFRKESEQPVPSSH
ncbi:MAG: alpha/beta hydrolase family protein [Chthoniobacterales bacterium]